MSEKPAANQTFYTLFNPNGKRPMQQKLPNSPRFTDRKKRFEIPEK
jgi:hypothetical protein